MSLSRPSAPAGQGPRERSWSSPDREGAWAGRGCRFGEWRNQAWAFEERGHLSDPLTSTTEGEEDNLSSPRAVRSTWSTLRLTTSRTPMCTTKVGPSAPGLCRGGAPVGVLEALTNPANDLGDRTDHGNQFGHILHQNRLRFCGQRSRGIELIASIGTDLGSRRFPRWPIFSLRHRHRASLSS
jgi:hypothetical protein